MKYILLSGITPKDSDNVGRFECGSDGLFLSNFSIFITMSSTHVVYSDMS